MLSWPGASPWIQRRSRLWWSSQRPPLPYSFNHFDRHFIRDFSRIATPASPTPSLLTSHTVSAYHQRPIGHFMTYSGGSRLVRLNYPLTQLNPSLWKWTPMRPGQESSNLSLGTRTPLLFSPGSSFPSNAVTELETWSFLAVKCVLKE